jgi:cytochrome c
VIASVASTVPGATLSVGDPATFAPGRLVNGTSALAQPLRLKASSAVAPGGPFVPLSGTPSALLHYAGTVSGDAASIELKQSIGAAEPLVIGTYAKTVVFTLSAATP